MKVPRKRKETPTAAFALPGVEVEQLERLLAFMATHGLEEFEYEHGGMHVRLRKASAAREQPVHIPAAAARPVAFPPVSAEAARSAEVPAQDSAVPQSAEDLHLIKSPIVGTFYSASSPEADPFVKPGDTVHSGQVVCIIEAMKLMNEIETDIAGKVVKMLVENGQPVEYGQALFAIRPEL